MSSTGARTVSRDDVRRFALAIGAMAPVHHEVEAARAAGYRDLLGPPHFFSALGMSFGRDSPPWALRADGMPPEEDEVAGRVMAGGVEVHWFGDICANDIVHITMDRLEPEEKDGASGQLRIHPVRRTYSIDGRVTVEEIFTRIGR